MVELKAQLSTLAITPSAIVFASSSGGTQAGLALGARLTGFKGQILGISIDQTKTGEDSFLPVLTQIARETATRIGSDLVLNETDFSLDCDYLGAGYAKPGALEFTAIERLAQEEGILLGPVYTARAMGALLDLIQQKVFTRGQSLLFWHTGGTPELFAWADRF
jgi:D-cysteine desulfhydrase